MKPGATTRPRASMVVRSGKRLGRDGANFSAAYADVCGRVELGFRVDYAARSR